MVHSKIKDQDLARSPAPFHPAHQSHTAAMDTGKAAVDPRALNYTRPLFSQLLLLLAYVLLESSLPARNGDIRQIQDICSRKETEWQPQIGGEIYPEMKQTSWDKASPETRRAWRDIRSYLFQQNLVHSTVSGKHLREYLCQLLWWIEQVSAQGLSALCGPRNGIDSDVLPLTEKGCIVLLCVSVSVTATPGGSVSLRSLLHDQDQLLIKEMQPQLAQSPIFPDNISRTELRNAFATLELIFSTHTVMENTPLKYYEPDWMRSTVVQREIWTQYELLSETRNLSFPSGPYATQQPCSRKANADRSCSRDAGVHPRKRQRRPSLRTEKWNARSSPLAIEYH